MSGVFKDCTQETVKLFFQQELIWHFAQSLNLIGCPSILKLTVFPNSIRCAGV